MHEEHEPAIDVSFDQWYPETFKRLVSFNIKSLGLPQQIAEDVAQDAIETFIRSGGRDKSGELIQYRDSWLYKIDRNRAIKVSRDERRAGGAPPPGPANEDAGADDATTPTIVISHRKVPTIEEIPDPGRGVEDTVIEAVSAVPKREMIEAARERCASQQPGPDNPAWCEIKHIRDGPEATTRYRDTIWSVARISLLAYPLDEGKTSNDIWKQVNEELGKAYPEYFEGEQLSSDNHKQRRKRARAEVQQLWRRWGFTPKGSRAMAT